MDHLEEAKELARRRPHPDEVGPSEYAQACVQAALAHAVIALVERLDRVTIQFSDEGGNERYAIEVSPPFAGA